MKNLIKFKHVSNDCSPSTTEEKIRDYTDLEYHAAEKRGREADDCERIFSGCNNYFLDKITKIFT